MSKDIHRDVETQVVPESPFDIEIEEEKELSRSRFRFSETDFIEYLEDEKNNNFFSDWVEYIPAIFFIILFPLFTIVSMVLRFCWLSAIADLLWDYCVPIVIISLTGVFDAISRSPWLRKIKPSLHTPWKKENWKVALTRKDKRLRCRIICDILAIVFSVIAASAFKTPWALFSPFLFLTYAGKVIVREIFDRIHLDHFTSLKGKTPAKANAEKQKASSAK